MTDGGWGRRDFVNRASRSRTLIGRPKVAARLLEPALRASRQKDSFELPHDAAFAGVDALELVHEVVSRVRDRAAEKSVEVVVRCTTGVVSVDRRVFVIALGELLENAVHASSAGGRVHFTVHDTAEGDVLWQIRDQGVGMSVHTLGALGEEPGPSNAQVGAGVVFAWSVIEAHGGLLRFESGVGVGTTASVWLPGWAAAAPLRAPDFKALFQAVPEPLVAFAPDAPRFTVVGVTEAFLLATGLERQDVVGRSASEIFPEAARSHDDLGSLPASLARVVLHCAADAMGIEKRMAPRKGVPQGELEERYWSRHSSPVLGTDGRVSYILHRVEDVTDGVRIEEAHLATLMGKLGTPLLGSADHANELYLESIRRAREPGGSPVSEKTQVDRDQGHDTNGKIRH